MSNLSLQSLRSNDHAWNQALTTAALPAGILLGKMAEGTLKVATKGRFSLIGDYHSLVSNNAWATRALGAGYALGIMAPYVSSIGHHVHAAWTGKETFSQAGVNVAKDSLTTGMLQIGRAGVGGLLLDLEVALKVAHPLLRFGVPGLLSFTATALMAGAIYSATSHSESI